VCVCEAIGTAATPGLLCQPRVIVKMIVETQMECRLAGETEVLGENLPQLHFCPSQNLTWPDPGLNPGSRGGKPATNRLSYGAASRELRLTSSFNVVPLLFSTLGPSLCRLPYALRKKTSANQWAMRAPLPLHLSLRWIDGPLMPFWVNQTSNNQKGRVGTI
jgi:hypothetical protein